MFKAGAWDGVLFGVPVTTLSTERFIRYLELYNVGWIVAHSSETRHFVKRMPFVSEQQSIGSVSIYKVEQPLNYFEVGSGSIETRHFDRIVLSGLRGNEVILKYHFSEKLVADPPLRLEAVRLDPDLPPFIRLVSPPDGRVTLTTR
jgi:hypothetical protein